MRPRGSTTIPYPALIFPLALAACTPQLLREPIQVHPSARPRSGDLIAQVARVEFHPTNGKKPAPIHMRRLRASVRSALLNSGRFQRVILAQREFPDREPGTAYIDVQVFGADLGEFQWWITWPAVYPMPGYWPIQQKKGVVRARLDVTAYIGSKKVFSKTISAEREYEIDIYGFYRTSPIERKIRECYEEILNGLTESLAAASFASTGDGPPEKVKPSVNP